MKYRGIMARSFSEHEQKRMGLGAMICCLLMAFTLSTVFKPYIGPLPFLYLERSMASGLKMLISRQQINEPYGYMESITPMIQNLSNSRSQVYEMNGETRIHGISSTIFIPTTLQLNASSLIIKPYARNIDRAAMGKVRNLTIINQNPNTTPPCSRRFDTPAIVFSIGGHTGNPFHDFTDVLVPLYLTSHQFNTTVIFLVSGKRPWWTSKYRSILSMLSKYQVVDIDKQNEVLCFPRVIAGLKSHKEFGIDQSISPNYSMTDFTKFLRQTYSLERGVVEGCRKRPRLLIISRKKTRRLTNEHEVAELARSVGFEVSVREMGWQVSLMAELVNSFDVMVAVHGAGMTNMVFLPENAVVVQIVPCGLEILSRNYFERPSKGMNLRYLEYKVGINESSLVETYGMQKEACRNPSAKGWTEFRTVYLDNQYVKVDLDRFRRTLLEAMKLVCS